MNLPEVLTGEARAALLEYRLDYLREGIRLLDAGQTPRATLDFTFGALRIGDVAAILAPGECLVADMDGDALPDIVITTQQAGSSEFGDVRAYDATGTLLAGFPIPLGG